MCLLLSIIHNFDQHRLIYLGFSVIIRPFICTQTIKHILFYNKSWTVFFISVSRYNHEILCSMSSTHFRYFPVGKLFTFFVVDKGDFIIVANEFKLVQATKSFK